VAYQDIDGQRVQVAVAYQTSEVSETSEVSALHAPPSTLYDFHVAPYDLTRPLILDLAVLVYCGYIGGNGSDWGYAIAVDGAGNAYVTGGTDSTEASFPVMSGPDLTYNGGYRDAFVTKVNAAGTGLVYAGYIDGNYDDRGLGIAVDGASNAYVTGFTDSTEASFPVTVGPDLTYNGSVYYSDAFVAKVSGPVPGTITAVGRHLERDGVPFEARGMDYYPKDYAWDRFWISYTLALTQTNEELDRAKALGVNLFHPALLDNGLYQHAPHQFGAQHARRDQHRYPGLGHQERA
jgi:hypothetical protein